MAKSKNTEEVIQSSGPISAKELLKTLKKKSKSFETLETMDEVGKLPVEYIDTGSYALNRIITGDYKKGIPVGRITAFAGEPSTGKSFICGRIIKNAIKDGFLVYLIDTENAYDEERLKNDGIDTEQIFFEREAATITDVKNICIPRIREIKKESPDAKILVVIDSIAALTTEKQLVDDIEKGKVGHDQGMKAKDMKLLATVLGQETIKNKLTVVITNHVYLKPGQNPTIAPEQCFTGGSGFVYWSSVIVFLAKKQQKEDYDSVQKAEFSEKTKIVKPTGMFIFATTRKNRFIPEGHIAELYINFERGLNRLFGLAEDAAEYGYIEKVHGGVLLKNSGKKIKNAELYKSENWDFLDELGLKVYEKLKFKPVQQLGEELIADSNSVEEKELEEEDSSR